MFVIQCVSEENKSGIRDFIKNTRIKKKDQKWLNAFRIFVQN